MAELEAAVLRALDRDGEIPDTGDFASGLKADHNEVVGVMKSLESAGMVESKVRRRSAGGSTLRGGHPMTGLTADHGRKAGRSLDLAGAN